MGLYGLDLENLLSPLEGENPAGVNMRAEGRFLALRDAQSESRAADRIALASEPGTRSEADWDRVASLATDILSQDSKDLEVAAWATEALVQTDGLAGLAFGANLMSGLIERYWEQLYPLPDEEDGLEGRLLPIVRLSGAGTDGKGSTLSAPLLNMRLFTDQQGNNVSLFSYERSEATKGITDDNELEMRLRSTIPYDEMQQAARAAGPGLWSGWRQNLLTAQAGWAAFTANLDKAAGNEAPSTSYITELLRRIGAVVNRYAPAESIAAPAEAGQEMAEANGSGMVAAGGAEMRVRKLATREDALANLLEIADYFRRTEPQSPLAYTIEEAIRRGRMSWPELLAELVEDANVRNNILTSLGIRPQD